MSMTAFILVILCGVACAYHLTAAGCAILFWWRRRCYAESDNWPKLACLKPLCGYDSQMPANLRTFLEQDYPDYQVIFGTATHDDSAYAIAARAAASNGGCSQAVFGEVGKGGNRKIRNLMNMCRYLAADTEVIVLSDSDTRVSERYLKAMLAPMCQDEKVGVVTSLYRAQNVRDLGGVLEALSIESSFIPGVLVVATFSSLQYAFGASIVIKRRDLESIGGFAAIAEYLADDYKIGNLIYERQKRVALASYVVPIVLSPQSLRTSLRHLLRWNRTIRVCQPAGYAGSILAYPVFWALLAAATIPVTTAWMLLASVSAIRVVATAIVSFAIGSFPGIMRAILAPLWDVLATVLWAIGLVGKEVHWRGVKYRVDNDGRMVEIVDQLE